MESNSQTFLEDLGVYLGRVRLFDRADWVVYFLWCTMIFGLAASTGAFLYAGSSHGVKFPDWVWNIPIGAGIFFVAIAVDTIGHRTVYKEVLKEGEALIHHITIFCGITSVLALCLAYEHPFFRIPAIVLSFLSLVYSLFDEAMHWRRYLTEKSDRVEMWSHVFIMVGHLGMTLAWIFWMESGYPGVRETVAILGGSA